MTDEEVLADIITRQQLIPRLAANERWINDLRQAIPAADDHWVDDLCRSMDRALTVREALVMKGCSMTPKVPTKAMAEAIGVSDKTLRRMISWFAR